MQFNYLSRVFTSGTASLSACAEAASVVTVLLTKALLTRGDTTFPRRGRARLVLSNREDILCVVNG
jgi:hypothetical protein